MSVNFQMALRSFTRSVLLRAGRNIQNSSSNSSLETNAEEGDDVTIIFVMDDGTHCRAKAKEGDCLCDLAHKYVFNMI